MCKESKEKQNFRDKKAVDYTKSYKKKSSVKNVYIVYLNMELTGGHISKTSNRVMEKNVND